MTITAEVIEDSISVYAPRLSTLRLRYPRFIHAEFMTHRVFSRNASSSRAIPVERMIEDVMRDPAMPIHWGRNQKGMQARGESVPVVRLRESGGYGIPDMVWDFSCVDEWLKARDAAVEFARKFSRAGYHKQIVNRILEPFMHINVVVTATEWENFFLLRRHPDAQPEIYALADEMWEAMNASTPKERALAQWHLPFITEEDYDFCKTAPDDPEGIHLLRKLSVARCARVSYRTHDGKKTDPEEDLKLHDRLLDSRHLSPFEHVATPDEPDFGLWLYEDEHRNFEGWRQYRAVVE
ncbi:MAG TPA: FAD-dependent thymidylate synthase [Rhodopila sp.]|nr:FAD-dependent thymidylate synthase [Rhodopila sp.]